MRSFVTWRVNLQYSIFSLIIRMFYIMLALEEVDILMHATWHLLNYTKVCKWKCVTGGEQRKIYAEPYQKAQDTKNKCKQKTSQIIYSWAVSPKRSTHHPWTPCTHMLRAARKPTPNAVSEESKYNMVCSCLPGLLRPQQQRSQSAGPFCITGKPHRHSATLRRPRSKEQTPWSSKQSGATSRVTEDRLQFPPDWEAHKGVF